MSDASGLRMTIGQAMQWKRLNSHRGLPDLFIAYPRGEYAGLFIELKKTGEKIVKKDGVTLKNPHLVEQTEMLFVLKCLGYHAQFALGLAEAISILEEYMNHTSE
jgi:hypothetical protein